MKHHWNWIFTWNDSIIGQSSDVGKVPMNKISRQRILFCWGRFAIIGTPNDYHHNIAKDVSSGLSFHYGFIGLFLFYLSSGNRNISFLYTYFRFILDLHISLIFVFLTSFVSTQLNFDSTLIGFHKDHSNFPWGLPFHMFNVTLNSNQFHFCNCNGFSQRFANEKRNLR